MALKPPGASPDAATPRRDEAGEPRGAQKGPQKAVPRRPGHVLDTPGEQHEEQIAEPELQRQALRQEELQKKEAQAKDKAAEAKKVQKRREEEGRRQREESDAEPEAPPGSSTTAGHLAHDANWYRSRTAKKMGLDQSPSISEVVAGKEAAPAGESLAALLPSARARAHPALPDTEIRPPDFLTPLEAMRDIYMRTRGRMSRKTKELLEGPDLEDLLGMVRHIFEEEKLEKSAEARLKANLRSQLEGEPGPLLLGLNDPRLTEPWRLFLEGWDIWIPEGDGDGVELFWEGEAEDDFGEVLEMSQSVIFTQGELILWTKMGDREDHLTFDGEVFYRLKHR